MTIAELVPTLLSFGNSALYLSILISAILVYAAIEFSLQSEKWRRLLQIGCLLVFIIISGIYGSATTQNIEGLVFVDSSYEELSENAAIKLDAVKSLRGWGESSKSIAKKDHILKWHGSHEGNLGHVNHGGRDYFDAVYPRIWEKMDLTSNPSPTQAKNFDQEEWVQFLNELDGSKKPRIGDISFAYISLRINKKIVHLDPVFRGDQIDLENHGLPNSTLDIDEIFNTSYPNSGTKEAIKYRFMSKNDD